MSTQKEKINLYKPVEERFLIEISERLDFLKKYFTDRYFPLSPGFTVETEENSRYIFVNFWLEGSTKYRISIRQSINRNTGDILAFHEMAHEYIKKIKEKLEDEVKIHGILSIQFKK